MRRMKYAAHGMRASMRGEKKTCGAQEAVLKQRQRVNPVVWLILVVVLVTIIALGGAFALLPAPPGPPTPTAPYVLDRPEGLPRVGN